MKFKLILFDEDSKEVQSWSFDSVTLLFPKWWQDFKNKLCILVYQGGRI